MPSAAQILRFRRRRGRLGKTQRRLGALVLIALAGCFCLTGATAFGLSLGFDRLSEGLPDVGLIEQNYGVVGAEFFLPPRVYDRSGRELLSTIRNPASEQAAWKSLDPSDEKALPVYAVQASVLALDDSFWAHAGFEWGALLQASLRGAFGSADRTQDLTLTERLVETALLPVEDHDLPPIQRRLRTALLASQLTERYSRDQILSWHLNSAYYGRGAHGIDAAALVYFDKHADQLTLSEAALLAGLPDHPTRNPIDDLVYARSRQLETLDRMRATKLITDQEHRRAQRQPLRLSYASPGEHFLGSGYQAYLWQRIRTALGPSAHRSGLKIISTLDADLQEQAECAARSHLERMSGGEPGSVVPGKAGSSCVAAGLLPPLRPGDTGIDHNIGEWSLIVLDPQSGELLSALGSLREQRKLGTAFYPFVYLTAFSRGYAPASMILDLPPSSPDIEIDPNTAFQGPVSMRTALTNALGAAGQRMIQLAGLENVLRIGRQMGLAAISRNQLEVEMNQTQDRVTGDLLEMALASGVIANSGKLVGERLGPENESANGLSLEPLVIREIQDLSGNVLFAPDSSSQPVLSAPLAYLLVDVLSDLQAHSGNPTGMQLLDIGRPVGMIPGVTDDGLDNWAAGFSPQRVVAVRISAQDASGMSGIGEENGAAAIWFAVQRYAERALPEAGWERPVGVNEVEVCTPSGLLPTAYCPQTVREVFIYGTEPSSYDTLFQPFRVNRETGKLATLFTPVDLVEERVYLIPPDEAAEWAVQVGLERPPQEYDTIAGILQGHPEVAIEAPGSFEILRGSVNVRGTAQIPALRYYRLQYGEGLNPTRWIQLGSDQSSSVSGRTLLTWETQDLNGLFTLQLLAVNEDGQVFTASLPVTIDNRAPEVRMVLPEEGATFSLKETEQVLFEAQALDEHSVVEVQFYVDGQQVGASRAPPFVHRWRVPLREGLVEIHAVALDQAGNTAESDPITIRIER